MSMTEEKIKIVGKGTNHVTDACLTIATLQAPYIHIETEKVMRKEIEKIQAGDLDSIVEILTAQAMVLNQVFSNEIKHIASVANEDLQEKQIHAHLALKAQNQCRNTLSALAEIKRPNRTIFVRQQNNAFNQQINCSKNELPEKNPANELLENENGKRLDSRTEVPPVTVNPSMEAMDTINRREND